MIQRTPFPREGFFAGNPALDRMRSGEAAIGMIVRLSRSGEIARIAGNSGQDFIFIDMQHAVFSTETVADIAQTALGCGVTPLVRVRGVADPNIGPLLDNGATGIIFPDVNTPEEARACVAACRFPPRGRRSAAGGYAVFNTAAVPLAEAIPAMDAATLVVCMIETRQGLENAEAIAAVEGVDVLHIGCNDLLIDMGRPGAFTDAALGDGIRRVIAACRKHGKYAGLGGDKDRSRQAAWLREGIRFTTLTSDAGFIAAGAAQMVEELRASRPG
ncbi:aldolase/citrate lyase family protein [Roseomonas sp. OT10]|uniref:HpcH/HpaI aldolase family protein n=1 Tax=Roseomonas cutis TaxID=2897332 RepID=UPI001E577093|nr:aldolase/citrate lyase family protein [Roseomonas sp. OT10]UFN49293.1 aldolase/citrate lyase family protein [Roseomonas sp. OT10]